MDLSHFIGDGGHNGPCDDSGRLHLSTSLTLSAAVLCPAFVGDGAERHFYELSARPVELGRYGDDRAERTLHRDLSPEDLIIVRNESGVITRSYLCVAHYNRRNERPISPYQNEATHSLLRGAAASCPTPKDHRALLGLFQPRLVR